MAFEPQKLSIVPKGLNLVPPGDQVADGDCLELTGWWPGSMGRLQQARGWNGINATVVSHLLDTLCECNGRIYYGGAGYLYQIGRDSGGVYIDNLYDGYPLGVCAFQGIVWVMNRAHTSRDDGTAIAPWGVEVPSTAPSYTELSGGGLADGTHNYYVTFVDIHGYESNPSPIAPVPLPPGAEASGTVAVATGSVTITLSGSTWPSSITGQSFRVSGDTASYTVTYVDATHATLNTAYTGASDSAASYLIYSAANTSAVTITRPASTLYPALIAGWNLYRQSPGSGSIYQVNATMVPYATTTYTDYGDAAHSQDQATLILNDVVMEGNHDWPPAARVMAAQPYNGRLVVGSSAAYPNRIWYTPPLQPHYFPGSADPQSGNWVDIGNDTGDAILHISVKNGYLLVYREKSIWRITGDLGDASSVISPLIPNMGIAGPRAVVATSNGDLALVRQGTEFGIYRVTDWEQRISGKVELVLNGMGSECYPAIAAAAAATCALGFQLGRLWFAYPDGSNTYPNRVLVCDVEQDSFSYTVSGRWFSRYGEFGAFLHGVNYFLGCGNGRVYSVEDGTGDEDTAYTTLAYQSAYLDCGNPDHEKTYGDLVISHNTGGATLTLKIRVNKNADSFTLANLTSSSLTRQEIPLIYPVGHANAGLPIEGFNLAVRLEGNGPKAFPGAYIDGPMILHYFLKPRKAMTWDSGPTDHGQTGVKTVDAVEIDFDGGALTLLYQSDIPGGVLTERSTGGTGIAVAASSGRQVVRVILPAAVNGRVLRYQLYASGATPFLLYNFRVRALPVGVYVDGTFGDTWFTEPIAAGGSVAADWEAPRRERLPQEM